MPCPRDEDRPPPGMPGRGWQRSPLRRLPLRAPALALACACAMWLPALPAAGQPAFADGASQLTQAVRAWASVRHGVPVSALAIQLPDSRVSIRPCAKPWQFDQPFSQAGTIRARCDAPAWQVYVQVQGLPGQAQAAAPSAPVATTAALAAPPPAAPQPSPTNPPAAQPQPAAWTPPAPAPAVRTLVTVTSLLPRGTRLQAEHLVLSQVPAIGLPPQMIERVSDALNAEIIRDLPAGTPLRPTDIRPALLVKRGQNVTMLASPVPGLRIAANLEALEDGRLGDIVRLRNRESGRIVSATVTGPSSVQGM